MWNLYGPTETNVCTAYQVDSPIDPAWTSIPIGRAVSGDRVWVKTSDGAEAQIGEEGSSWCKGPPFSRAIGASRRGRARPTGPATSSASGRGRRVLLPRPAGQHGEGARAPHRIRRNRSRVAAARVGPGRRRDRRGRGACRRDSSSSSPSASTPRRRCSTSSASARKASTLHDPRRRAVDGRTAAESQRKGGPTRARCALGPSPSP